MEEKYESIIGLPPPRSERHPPMSLLARAAQFAPFAALSGLEAAVLETQRVTEGRPELDEYEIERIDKKLREVSECLGEESYRLTVFVRDKRKSGGSILTLLDTVDRIDTVAQLITLGSGRRIGFENILKIDDAPALDGED